jgi:trehalose/maltose hydrolase-like predicted phosphorylase
MDVRRFVAVTTAVAVAIALPGAAQAASHRAPRQAPTPTGSYLLTATGPGPTYAPTFTGNGLLGVRVPPAGQGFAAEMVPAQSELAGFYAQPSGDVQRRANIPTWSTLTFSDGGTPFSLGAGTTSNWQQSLDLHTGIVTTTARWTAPNGHVTDLSYQVLTSRARPNVGLVQLTLTPQWSGTATVTDTIDGTPATLTRQVSKAWATDAHRDWVTVRTQGTGITAAISSQVQTSGNVAATVTQTDQSTDQSVGQELDFPVTAGISYTITKYVGVVSSQTTPDPTAAAQTQASSAATTGFNQLLADSKAAWAALWNGRIDIAGNRALATDVNASEFYLWSSIGPGVDWSVSPAGLSSNGYDGHIFWDGATWMFPSLLAQHQNLAATMNAYRFDRLQVAQQHAVATGFRGARYPWESALDGTEQTPPPVSVNSEGLYEQHITADVALAQWQYYLATGDKRWLATRGWPVISNAAAFWASRVTQTADGRFHMNGITGPDEENPNVNDEAYTNVAARTTLQNAVAAAKVLAIHAPGSWSRIARRIVVPTNTARGFHPEFAGYAGQLVKQADVTLLPYPWAFPMTQRLALGDLNYYVPRTDPTGPSMSDAIGSIDASALGTAGCSSYVYTLRSYQPFIKDVFDQFSETRTGGAFTFMTGIGGFLQEFLYGYSGLRWQPTALHLDPSLTSQLRGLVLRGLTWRGRRLTISIGRRTTTVTLNSGRPLTLTTPSGSQRLFRNRSLSIPTRRPDLNTTTDVVRCTRASADSEQPSGPALAAVDGSPATGWQPVALPATLTVGVQSGGQPISKATIRWGQQWPPAPGPNIPPPPGPVTTLRASTYALQVSDDGQAWRTIATLTGRTAGTVDVLRFPSTSARFVRLQITAGTGAQPPMLQELTVTG